MSNLKISLVQTHLIWENRAANLSAIENFIERELSGDTDIIILPEMFTSGFTMNVDNNYDVMDGETVRWMSQISARYNSVVCGSVIIKEAGKFYNRFLWIDAHSNKILSYDKKHLFCLAQEDHYFTAGTSKIIIEYKNWRIEPFICYDLRFPVWMRNADQVDLQIVVANFPKKRRQAWNSLLVARAIENQCFVAGVNIIGEDGNGIPYSGDSAIYDYQGETKLQLSNTLSIVTAELQKYDMDVFRRAYPFLQDRDPFQMI